METGLEILTFVKHRLDRYITDHLRRGSVVFVAVCWSVCLLTELLRKLRMDLYGISGSGEGLGAGRNNPLDFGIHLDLDSLHGMSLKITSKIALSTDDARRKLNTV